MATTQMATTAMRTATTTAQMATTMMQTMTKMTTLMQTADGNEDDENTTVAGRHDNGNDTTWTTW